MEFEPTKPDARGRQPFGYPKGWDRARVKEQFTPQRLMSIALAPTPIALALRMSGALASFVTTFLIARFYGATMSGEYSLAVQTALTAAALSILGLDQIILRTMGGDLREGRRDNAHAALMEAARFVTFTSIAAAALLVLASPLAPWIGATPRLIALSALVLLVMPILRIAVCGLRATNHVILSQFVDGPIQSGTLAVAILLATLVGHDLNSDQIILMNAGCLLLACLLGWIILRRIVAKWPRSQERQFASIATVGWPVVSATGTHMLTGWVLMALVGAYAGAAEVGAFRVAIQIMTIITMIITTVESIINPQYAGDFRTKRYDLAHRRHRRGTLMLLATAGPPVLVCLIFPHQLLSLFGPEFVVAAPALRIMAFAQLVNVVTGPLGSMLLMAGRERVSLVLALIGFAMSTALALWLTPMFGVTGAAIGFACALVFRIGASYFLIFFRYPEMRRSRPAASQHP